MNLRPAYEVVRSEWLLWSIVAAAFLLRIVGIGYGLPITVVGDEYPFTYAALQMIQSHSIVPNFHPELFSDILPYPPYLSYALLLPFVVILAVKYMLFSGSIAFFQASLLSDLSPFFMTARFLSVMAATLSVFLVYRISEKIFHSRVAAAASAALLAASILHIALSMVGRNWIIVSLVYLLGLYILTRDWSVRGRYLTVFIVAGFGMGVSSISAVLPILAGLYYLLYDLRSPRQVFDDASALGTATIIFIALALLPNVLWQSGNAFLGAVTLFSDKTVAGFFSAPWSLLSLVLLSEPIFVSFFAAGMVWLFFAERRTAIFLSFSILIYAEIFYTFFRFESRFLLPMIPLMAIAGGFLIDRLWEKPYSRSLVIVLFAIAAISAGRFSYLAFMGDTREQALQWVLQELHPDEKILVFSAGMHIPTAKDAAEELQSIDPRAMRKVDEADIVLDRNNVPFALNNLTSIVEQKFIDKLPGYVHARGYHYLLVEPRSIPGSRIGPAIDLISKNAEPVKAFSGLGDSMSIYNSELQEPFWSLFSQKMLGPDIVIYHLHD